MLKALLISLLSYRHPRMLGDGWLCAGCIIFKDYNGLVFPHKEWKCQYADIVALLNTVEIKRLCWIHPLICAYPSEKLKRTLQLRERRIYHVWGSGYLLMVPVNHPVEIIPKKSQHVWKGKKEPEKGKGQTCPWEPEVEKDWWCLPGTVITV